MTEKLWMMSVQACPLIAAVLLAGLLLLRYPKVYSYSLWMLVLVRLLCPVFIESPLSLQPDLYRYLPGQSAEERGTPEELSGPAAGDEIRGQSGTDAELAEKEEPFEAGRTASRGGGLSELPELFYLLGVLISAGTGLFQYVGMRRRVALAVRDRENIWLCGEISSPFVLGLVRPRIYLPFGLSENERIYIVRHERMHIRHGDSWVRLAGLAALCLHWWNPLVWCAVRKLFQDMEMYCDESVLEERTFQERKKYADILLKFAVRQSGLAKALSFGASNTEKRIRNILKDKKKSAAVHLLLLLFVGGCTYLFLTVPIREQSGGAKESADSPSESLAREAYALEDMPVPMREVTLSDTSVLSDGVPFRVLLVMTKGEYFTEEYAGAGGGIFEENYSGSYELCVLNEKGGVIARCPVRDEFGGDRFNFGGKFELAAADYNGDGCADFTLGTWGSSSMGLYYLYTVSGEGEISLAYPEGIEAAGLKPSKAFEHTEQGFVTYVYDNAAGEYSGISYVWEETRGEYVKGEAVPVPEGTKIP